MLQTHLQNNLCRGYFQMAKAVSNKPENKSVRRTKKCIKKSFAKLLSERDISKITVTDLINDAEISRTTFYAHYSDIFDLFERISEEECDKLIARFDEEGIVSILTQPEVFFSAVRTDINKDIEYYRQLFLSGNSDKLIEDIKSAVFEYVAQYRKNNTAIKTEIFTDFYVSYLSNAVTGAFLDWLKGRINMTDNQFVEDLSVCIRNTFSGVFPVGEAS